MTGVPGAVTADSASTLQGAALHGGAAVLLRIVRRPAGAIALAWIVLVTVACAAAPLVAPHSQFAQDLTNSYSGPTLEHWLGTDQLGRDILSRMLYGGSISLLSVVQAVIPYVLVGLLFGLIAGYIGGWVDRVIMRACDIIMAIPLVIVVLIVLAIFSQNQAAAMITFGLLAGAGLVRIVRAVTLAGVNEDYVVAARVAGLSRAQIVRRHLLPRVVAPVVIQASLLAASVLLVESGLNYLGLGVQPPIPSWGGLVAEASTAISRHPWLLVPSGGIIILTSLAFAVVGDVARDAVADRSNLAPRSWRHLITRAFRRPGSEPAAPVTRTTAGTSLLTLRGLDVRTATESLVRSVDLDLRAGEILGIVGESGCGKSLTISALLRLLPAGVSLQAAEYTLAGRDVLGMTERQVARLRGSEIGFIPQEPVAGLDPSYTIARQLVPLARHHLGLRRAPATAYVRDLLLRVQLPHPDAVLKAYPHQLSGGMAQRVAIGRALIGNPELIVADEPTTALDVTVQAEILQLLRSLRDERGVSVIIVTHDWGVVADVCDRAAVMYAGEIVEEGPVRALFHEPKHPYTAALLEANPSGAEVRQKLQAIPGRVPPPSEWPVHCAFQARCNRSLEECSLGQIPMREDEGHQSRCLNPLPVPQREEARRVAAS